MKIATWNVNSIKTRLDHLRDWLDAAAPDVVLLQELKCVEDNFPFMDLKAAGYAAEMVGQKTYNGVAILAKGDIEVTATRLPDIADGDADDEQARYIEARIDGVRVASIYLPNGNPAPGDKFDYKIQWMRRLFAHARELLKTEEPVVLGGDYNVIPEPRDAYDPKRWEGDALYRPESRSALRYVLNLGYTDAFRALNDQGGQFSWWDYRSGAWDRDEGCRIDHLLLSPQAADRLTASGIDKTPRGWQKPSDHTPVWCELSDGD